MSRFTSRAQRGAPRYRRAEPRLRREELIEATLTCLRKFGHDGASARRIGAAAGVSPGLIHHHFPSIATLIAAAYEQLAMQLLESIRRYALDHECTPLERLRRFFQASFAPHMLDPALFKAWLVFWSQISHDPQMRAVHERTWGAYRATLETMLAELRRTAAAPAFDVRLAALALSALLDGLWVESSLNPRGVAPAEAVSLCEDWTRALCAGALPGLRAPGRRGPAQSTPRSRVRRPRSART
jgi:AcrR family transcriptional regulator